MGKLQRTNLHFDGVLQTRAESVIKKLRVSFCRIAPKKCVLYLMENIEITLISPNTLSFSQTQ